MTSMDNLYNETAWLLQQSQHQLQDQQHQQFDWAEENTTIKMTKHQNISMKYEHFDYYLWVFVSPPLLLFGLTGNIVTLLVMQRKAFRSTSTSVYMSLLAAMDTSFLIVGLLFDWLEWCSFVTIKYLHVWTCRVYRLVFYGTGDAAIWLIVAFSFDRFVAICFPLHKSHVCTRTRALLAFIFILIAAVSKNLHVLWTRGNRVGKLCTSIAPYIYFETYVRPWLAFSLAMALPFCLILLFNCLMVRSLMRAQRRRSSTQLMATRGSCGNVLATGTKANTGGSKTYMQTTLMCLSVSFTFLFCIAPSIVLLVGKPNWESPDNVGYIYSKVINNLLVYVNHSINFVLYCLTGQRFRTELVALFKSCRWAATPGQKSTTGTYVSDLSANGGPHDGRKRLSSASVTPYCSPRGQGVGKSNSGTIADRRLRAESIVYQERKTDLNDDDLQ